MANTGSGDVALNFGALSRRPLKECTDAQIIAYLWLLLLAMKILL